jgi:hypothetical protein
VDVEASQQYEFDFTMARTSWAEEAWATALHFTIKSLEDMIEEGVDIR